LRVWAVGKVGADYTAKSLERSVRSVMLKAVWLGSDPVGKVKAK